MYNVRNNFTLVGRVVDDAAARKAAAQTNSDGSQKAFLKIAVEDNYQSSTDSGKEYGREFISVEKFIKAGKDDFLLEVEKGNLVAIEGHITCKAYEKDGEMIYPAPKLVCDKVTPLARAKGGQEEE